MKNMLTLMVLINYKITQVSGVLEWTVIGKVTDYGQNVTLFCHVPNCCPQDAGWDRWTPVQRTLFIDVKSGRSNKKYDGRVMKDGYTLVIQNLTKHDLNVSYSCLYGVTLGEQKLLLEDDAFTYDQTGKSIISKGYIAGIMVGVVALTAVAVALFFHNWRRRKKRKFKYKVPNEDIPLIVKDGSHVECKEGEDAKLIYESQNENLSVKLLKPGTCGNIHTEHEYREGRYNFVLRNTKTVNSGEYNLQVGRFFRKKFKLQITAYFLEDPTDIECNEGEEAIIKCRVRPGSPSVNWFKNDNDLSENDNYKISSEDGQHQLKLLESKLDDKGEYCVHVGKSVRKVKLKIKEIPKEIDNDERGIYMEAIKSGTEKRQYVRIQVIGKDRVGKTSIVRRLLNETHDGTSTDGLEINRNCQIRIKDGEWILGKVASEKKKRIARILDVVSENKNVKESVSNQQCPSESNGHKPIQSENRFANTEKKEQGPLEKISTPRLDVVPKNNTEKNNTDIILSVKNSSTKESIENTVDVSEEQIKESDQKDTTIRDRIPGSPIMSQEHHNQVNLEEAEKISDQMLSEKMNEILSRAHIVKDSHTSEAVVDCGIWDFAGQKDYYATHQTFFTPNAIYLLVTDIDNIAADMKSSKDDEEVTFDNIGDYIDFWLDSIHCFCKDPSADKLCPPVIMVCTGTDKVPANEVEKRKQHYEKKFLDHFRKDLKVKHRRGLHFISNKIPSTVEIDILKKHISTIAKEMNYFSENLPTRWIELENALDVFKDLKKTICSMKHIETLARNLSISVKELNIFLKYQHNIGNIIFFKDKPDYIILQPSWLVKCFRCLVCDNNKKHYGSSLDAEMSNLKLEGQLSEKLIDELFKKESDLKFGEHKDHILDVMEIFDIIVKPNLPNTKEEVYYMPCMIEKSSVLKNIIEENFNFENPHRTPWLVLVFKFLPIAYFNHILFNYIRKYRVCSLKSGHPAIYTGKAIVHLDETNYNLLIICFSHNAISLQIYSAKHEINKDANDKTYAHILRKLCSKIEKLEKSLMHKLSYNIQSKCSTGNYTIPNGRISYSKLKEETYFCDEHKRFHSTEDIENTWLKHTNAESTAESTDEKAPEIKSFNLSKEIVAEPTQSEMEVDSLDASWIPHDAKTYSTSGNDIVQEVVVSKIPQYPKYEQKEERLKSFMIGWSRVKKQTPEDMASAGFFYTGKEDIVQCFYCAGKLGQWKYSDEPLEEHKRWFPDCPFITKS